MMAGYVSVYQFRSVRGLRSSTSASGSHLDWVGGELGREQLVRRVPHSALLRTFW